MISTRDIVKLLLSLGLTAFFLRSAFHSVELQQVWEILLQSRFLWLLAGLVAVVLASYPRAFRWRILMAPVLPEVRIGKLFHAILIGYAGNNLIPRAGEIAKVWVIERNPGRISGLLATVAVERLIDLVVLLGMFGWVTFYIRDRLEEVFPGMGGMVTSATVLIGLAAVGVLILSLLGDRLLDRIGRSTERPLVKRCIAVGKSFLQGIEAVRTPRGYLKIAFWTVLLNVLYILALYLPFYAFDFSGRFGLGLLDAIVVLTIATLGIVIPTPGGAGTYHYFCSRALHGLYGIPLEEAVAFATVVHGLMYVTFLLLGGPGLITLVWRRRGAEQA